MALSNITTDIDVFEYPKYDKIFGEELTEEEITDSIHFHINTFRVKFLNNRQYYYGNNQKIVNEPDRDINDPDNRIAVPYSRTFVSLIKGYMYKPGLIKYDFADDQYGEIIKQIYKDNNEQLINAENGENQGKFGIGFDILWTDENAMPRFTTIKPDEIIPIFNYDVDNKLISAIRYYEIDSNLKDTTNDVTIRVEVYYPNKIVRYELRGKKLELKDEFENIYDDIPIDIFPNNTEYLADYESVKQLIDAYDRLTSDGTNELDRFAFSYLVIENFILGNDDIEREQQLDLIKKLRVWELHDVGDKKSKISFLNRDIPVAFYEMYRNTIREDIEYHSQIPDFRSEKFKAQSGEAMRWALTQFENLAGDKQALFEVGLQRRLRLINNSIEKKLNKKFNTDVKILFFRNTPKNEETEAKIFSQLFGKTSNKLALSVLSRVDDPDKELERMEEEENKARENLDIDEIEIPEEEAEEENPGEENETNS